MSVRQIIYGRQATFTSSTVAQYSGFPNYGFRSSTESVSQQICSAAGTLSNLTVLLSAAPGGSITRTFTLRVNNVDTALTVSIGPAATSASDTTHSVSVSPGDILSLKDIAAGGTSATADVAITAEFNSTNAGESIYGNSQGALQTGSTTSQGPLCGNNTSWAVGSYALESVIAVPGAITRYDIKLTVAPGAAASGKQYAFALVKNTVVQDGSGGTTNTTGVILETATSVTWTGSLALAAGDQVSLQCVPTGTPAVTNARFGVCFTATNDGESNLCGLFQANMSNSATNYASPEGRNGISWTATESAAQEQGGVNTAYFYGLQVIVLGTTPNSPGSGKSYALKIRKNTADGTVVATLADLNTACSDIDASHYVSVASGDTFALSSTPSGTPTLLQAGWAMRQSSSTPGGTSGVGTTGAQIRMKDLGVGLFGGGSSLS